MFGSINTDSASGKGILLIYGFMILVMVYLWIRLLMKKREPEKAIAIMTLAVAVAALISLAVTLFRSPINSRDLIEDAVLAAVFVAIGATETILYLKKRKKEDPTE